MRFALKFAKENMT